MGQCLESDIKTSFRYNLQIPIHRWYPFPEGFSAQFVRRILREHKPLNLLDPFVGVGTTLVEAKRRGIHAVGIDANPFMCFVSRVKTANYDPEILEKEARDLLSRLGEEKQAGYRRIPKISHYFRPETAEELIAIKQRILKVPNLHLRNLFLLCLASIIVPASNAKRSPALRFSKRRSKFPTVTAFKERLMMAIEDVSKAQNYPGSADVCFGDSRYLPFTDTSFDLIITSPPYCNNVDFIRHLQLELFLLGFAKKRGDLRILRERAITSCEAMAYAGKDKDKTIRDVEIIAKKIGKKTKRRWPEMVRQYFSGMKKHFKSLHPLMASHSKAFYVIGDSWIKGVHVPTTKILRKIALSCGFKHAEIEALKHRKSGNQHNKPLLEYMLQLTN